VIHDRHHHHHQGCDYCRVATVNDLDKLEARIMATLDEVLAKARENNTILGSINTLLDGLRQQIADILSGAAVPASVQVKIDEVFAALTAQRTELDEVLTENTQPPTP